MAGFLLIGGTIGGKTDEGSLTFARFGEWRSLKAINVSEENDTFSSADGVLFSKDKTVLMTYPQGKKDTEYEIPNGVLSLGNDAFVFCTNLKSVKIIKSITRIESGTFSECTSLKNVYFDGVICEIGEYAFAGCTSLENIVIPSGVEKEEGDVFTNTKLGQLSFECCSNLKKIILHSTVNEIAEDAFELCDNLIIYGDKGSKAEEYATDKGITFRVYGDINGDGICKSTDAMWLNNYLTDRREFNEEQQERADLNCDGKIKDSTTDLLRLKWKIVGLN